MEKNRKLPPPSSYKPEETSIARIASSPSKDFTKYRRMETTSSSDMLRNYSGVSPWDTKAQDIFRPTYFPHYGVNDTNMVANLSTTGGGDMDKKMMACQWEAAQHSLFQFSNMCFLTAFIIPRNYKSGILLFR